MPVLRSRHIPSPPNPSSSKTLKMGFIEPSTPAKSNEPLSSQSLQKTTTPTPNSPEFPADSTPVSGSTRRRSLRLASKFDSGENGTDSPSSTRKRGRNGDVDGKSQFELLSTVGVGNGDDFDCLGSVPVELRDARVSDSEEESNSVEILGDGEKEGRKGKRGLVGVTRESGYLSLRSGRRTVKRRVEGSNGEAKEEFKEDKGKGVLIEGRNGDTVVTEAKAEVKEDKGKGVLIVEGGEGDDGGSERGMVEDDLSLGLSDCKLRGLRKFTREEKGKGISTSNDVNLNNVDVDVEKLVLGVDKTNPDIDEGELADIMAFQMAMEAAKPVHLPTKHKMDQFKDIARRIASKFAHFDPQEEEENCVNIEAEVEVPAEQPAENVEDWPGPFSTAMKIIRDREKNLYGQVQNSSSRKGGTPLISWTPKKERNAECAKREVPLLQDLCLTILTKNVDAIGSLKYVPDVLRHKLSQMLCDSRRMNEHFLGLLLDGSPSEIRIADCSWLEEDKFEKLFGGCNTSNLMVLQLDLCGHCMSDSSLLKALLPKGLPALTTVSLKGACRISDVGLSALVSSAPALRSINLSQCSLVTDVGINNVANSLGSNLRELYLDDCESLDAMRILPALKRLRHVEVLSLRGIGSVSDKFMVELVKSNGQNFKELVLANCGKLTDSSLKVIAETCCDLCVLDLTYLSKLTDVGMAHFANGCRKIQDLKLCRSPFSDDAIAAFLETCGESLKDLSLNNIAKVGQNTTISLARRCKNLQTLDLSWCRSLTNEALGMIADSCSSLRVLKLFGCTQVTKTFLDGHSNPHLHIIGMKLTPILEHIKRSDFQHGPLHYSAVPSL